jgi:hypothetical protein
MKFEGSVAYYNATPSHKLIIETYWDFLLKHEVIIPDGEDDYLIWNGNVGCGRPYKYK